MLRIIAGLPAAVLAVLPFWAEAKREASCPRRDRDDPARTSGLRHRRLCAGYLSETRWILESDGRLRRILPVATRSGEGPFTEPTAGAQPWRRERVLMTRS